MSKRKRTGLYGEKIAAEYLLSLGYEIKSKNFNTRLGEIDLVAWDSDQLVFIEVKTSKSKNFAPPEELYHTRQRERLKKLAEQYIITEEMEKAYSAIRFDFIGISLEKETKLTHLKNIEL